MRLSRYVVETRTAAGETLLYNTANGAFVRVGPESRSDWERVEGGFAAEGDAAGLAAGDQVAGGQGTGYRAADGRLREMVDELSRVGMLVDCTAEDELARQRGLFDLERADSSHLTLSLIPTYACNHRCPYCYEIGHNKIPGKMDGRVMDAVESFVAAKHAQDGFERLSIQWYGGDPSLALDEVEELSGRLIAWADAHGVAYDAMMLTNASRLDDDDDVDLLVRCRVTSAFLTIDGPEQIHNRRRVAADGSNSYERTIGAARRLAARGVGLIANMNADKVNIAYYEELRQQLYREEGIVLTMGKLNDYGHFFGEAPFCAPEFDLFDHEEFFDAQFDEFARHPHGAGEFREKLRPIRRFCTGQWDNYFIIDLLGDVYFCDGRVGDKDYVRFSLFDDESSWKLHENTFDATRDAKCSACELLPVCQGSCIWERSCSGMPCHPFKTTIGGYLRLYRECFGDDAADGAGAASGGVVVLAEPFEPGELGWE